MGIKHGKSYLVTKNEGMRSIYRGGVKVGEFPAVGYSVQVFGECSGLTGTLIAAHAFAEVALDVAPYNRQYVLTAEEYEEHVGILLRSGEELMARFPYTPEEAASVAENEAKYAELTTRGRENMRRKLMNLSPHAHVTWDPNPRPRPELVRAEPEQEAVAGPTP